MKRRLAAIVWRVVSWLFYDRLDRLLARENLAGWQSGYDYAQNKCARTRKAAEAHYHCDACNRCLEYADVAHWAPPSCNGGWDSYCSECA